MADRDWKIFQEYMDTLNWSPSLQQRMRRDMSDKPMPSDVLPATPGFDAYEELARVQAVWERYPLNNTQACNDHWDLFLPVRCAGVPAPLAVDMPFYRYICKLFYENEIYWLERPTSIDRDSLRSMSIRLQPGFLAAAENAIEEVARGLIELLPAAAFSPVPSTAITMPLCDMSSNGVWVPNWLLGKACNLTHDGHRLLSGTYNLLVDRLLEANRLTLETYNSEKHKIVFSPAAEDSPTSVVRKYLPDNSDLAEVLTTPLPFEIPIDIFKEHGFLFAKSGHGKTQTLRAIFASLIERDCAVILIDGNGPLIKDISRIEAIQDRLLILDGNLAPPLNFFQMRGGSREKQMELFFYLFRAIDASLSEQQTTMISYLVDFVQQIPGGNLETLLQICENKELPHAEHLPKTDKYTQLFFQNQFRSKDEYVNKTKSALARRLYGLIRNRQFMSMFNAEENSFDALTAMQEKKIVIVDTTRNVLGDNGSAIFGRYILAQCLAAAWQRPEGERHLALIICDEAKAYLDDQSQKLLSDARNFGVGLLLATQFADQLKEDVRKEVSVNSSIKIAGPTTHKISGELYKDMRCTVDFIMDMKKRAPPHDAPPHYADWACYVDNMTPKAIKLRVPFFAVEQLPMTPPPLITPPPPRDGTMPRYREQASVAPAAPPPVAFLVGDIVQVTVGGYDFYRWGARITKIDPEAGMAWVDPTEFCPRHLVETLNDKVAALKPGEVLNAEEQVIERQTTVPAAGVLLKDIYPFTAKTPPPQSSPPIPKRERFTPP